MSKEKAAQVLKFTESCGDEPLGASFYYYDAKEVSPHSAFWTFTAIAY